jgi:hypothetical protein
LADGGHTVKAVNRPVTIRAHLRLSEPVAGGHYGVGLYNHRDAVVAGWAFEPVSLDAGYHVLEITIPQLPLQPGTLPGELRLVHRREQFDRRPPCRQVDRSAAVDARCAAARACPGRMGRRAQRAATFASRSQHAAPALALST